MVGTRTKKLNVFFPFTRRTPSPYLVDVIVDDGYDVINHTENIPRHDKRGKEKHHVVNPRKVNHCCKHVCDVLSIALRHVNFFHVQYTGLANQTLFWCRHLTRMAAKVVACWSRRFLICSPIAAIIHSQRAFAVEGLIPPLPPIHIQTSLHGS
jgi:hypothetical protein